MGSLNSVERPGAEEVNSARLHVNRSQVISAGLSGESWNYFSGLHTLASLLLDATPGR